MSASKIMTRREAAAYLSERGFKVSHTTLQKLATIGGGPVFRKFGARVIYAPEYLDAWVEQRLSPPLRSTSETA